MRVAFEHLSRQLEGRIAPLYTVVGNELLLAIEAADLIRARARQAGYTEREIFVLDTYPNWGELQHRGNSLSLFGQRRIMDIRIPSGKPGVQGGAVIEQYCRSMPPDTVTLVTLPRMDQQGQATKWFKALEEAGVMVSILPVERARLPAWIGERLHMQGQGAEDDTLQFLADKVEGNLLAAHQELKKLALLYPAGPLSFNEIKDAVLDVARYDVFKLSSAMVAGKIARYVRILGGLRGEGTPLPLIIGTLSGQVRSLIMIQRGLNSGRSAAHVMKQIRIWRDQQSSMENAAKLLSPNQLTAALVHAARIDRISKGVGKGDPWDELLQLGLRFEAAERTGA